MTERPILFSTEMVKAILEGRKTMTRRVVKKPYSTWMNEANNPEWWATVNNLCPYQIGMRLWVRETWAEVEKNPYDSFEKRNNDTEIIYKATTDDYQYYKWKPSIFMPRWTSRINLGITNIKVERLQDISKEDAKSEGIYREWDGSYYWYHNYLSKLDSEMFKSNPILSFQTLWDSINLKRGYGWNTNPWVWCIFFKRI